MSQYDQSTIIERLNDTQGTDLYNVIKPEDGRNSPILKELIQEQDKSMGLSQ